MMLAVSSSIGVPPFLVALDASQRALAHGAMCV